jgi:hypothetical protein
MACAAPCAVLCYAVLRSVLQAHCCTLCRPVLRHGREVLALVEPDASAWGGGMLCTCSTHARLGRAAPSRQPPQACPTVQDCLGA